MIFELINLIIFFFSYFFDILQNSQIIKRESVVTIKAEMDTMRDCCHWTYTSFSFKLHFQDISQH